MEFTTCPTYIGALFCHELLRKQPLTTFRHSALSSPPTATTSRRSLQNGHMLLQPEQSTKPMQVQSCNKSVLHSGHAIMPMSYLSEIKTLILCGVSNANSSWRAQSSQHICLRESSFNWARVKYGGKKAKENQLPYPINMILCMSQWGSLPSSLEEGSCTILHY